MLKRKNRFSASKCEHKESPHYAHGICKKCYLKRWTNKNRGPREHRKISLKSKYNITIKEYNRILKIQKGRCAICSSRTPGTARQAYFAVDHCHTKSKVRGLLCMHCNVGLGYFKDNIRILTKAIKYLRRTK